jgi:hypothetical protein
LQTFINNCARRIIYTKWTDKITNEELWRIAKQTPIEIQIKRKKWNSIGHTLRKEAGAIEKTALDWNRQGYRRRGRIFIIYLIIILNLNAPTLLSLVGDPLSGNGCGSPNHIYVISVLFVALLTQFILNN